MTSLPPYIDPEAWAGFVDMRKAIKKPLTPRAEKIVLKRLIELKNQGQDPNAVLDQSVLYNWQGIWPVKEEKVEATGRIAPATFDPPLTEEQKEASERARQKVMAKLRPGIRRVG